jgi:hypothetical protein
MPAISQRAVKQRVEQAFRPAVKNLMKAALATEVNYRSSRNAKDLPQRLKPNFTAPYRRPEGLLHPLD